MASPVIKIPLHQLRSELASERSCANQSPTSVFSEERYPPGDLLEFFPCVFYECSSALRISRVSPNSFEVIGVQPRDLIGTRAFWEERVLREDRGLLAEKLNDLEVSGSASVIHRIINDHGLPVWIAHSFRRAPNDLSKSVRGCIIPLPREKAVQDIERGVISRFVHKIGNHFQLLNLVINSLRRGVPESRETEVLRQTAEKAIELTRAFSDYCQEPTWLSEVDLSEVLNGAIITRKSSFATKGVELEVRIDDSVRGVTVQADPFLLESAIGGVLENALEATEAGGHVALEAEVEWRENNSLSVARFQILDTGCGIREEDLVSVTVPFFTSKKNHDGLGLSMAARFIEMHGGVLAIDSVEGKGTAVQITLPTNIARRPVER